MAYIKGTTNYSKAEKKRQLEKSIKRQAFLTTAKKKAKDTSKKINSTWAGNKKTTPSKAIKVKASRSPAQLRAIYAKKR